MKIASTSNYDLETYEEKFVAENIPNKRLAEIMARALNEENSPQSPDYYRAVNDDYKLFKPTNI